MPGPRTKVLYQSDVHKPLKTVASAPKRAGRGLNKPKYVKPYKKTPSDGVASKGFTWYEKE
jgi:hypothetical protein